MTGARRLFYCFAASILLMACLAYSARADTLAWDWIAGDCGTEPGSVLDSVTLVNEPAATVCVLPPSYQLTASLRVYVGVYIGSQYFPETSELADPINGHCVTVPSSPTLIKSSTQCTVLSAHYAGSIQYTQGTSVCTNCDDCKAKLSNPALTTVYLGADIINRYGSCIWYPTGFNNKTFDCQGHTIDGDDVKQGDPESGIYILWGTNNVIKNCVFSDFDTGIFVSFSPKNTITNNVFRSNNLGLYVTNGSNNTIVRGNRFEQNRNEGVQVIYESHSSVVSENTAEGNGTVGFYFNGAYYLDVSYNTAEGNRVGFYTYYPVGMTLNNNQALNNTNYGLQVYGLNSLIVAANTFCANGLYDIYSDSYFIGSQNKCDRPMGMRDSSVPPDNVYGCAYQCITPPVCGDGTVEPPEECDDGNVTAEDGCSPLCISEFCGDGILQSGLGEQCDDQNSVNGDGCRSDCTIELCGDGILDPSEECDDSNTNPGDGCDALCKTEPVNTPAGSDVTYTDSASGVVITFSTVATAGVTTVTVSDTGPATPGDYRLAADPAQYFAISTSAGYSGSIRVCLGYDPADILGPGEDLKLMHWNGEIWEDITDPPVDTLTNIVCGTTSALSPFAVMEPVSQSLDAEVEVNPQTINLNSKGQWITAYLEFPDGQDPAQVDVATVRFNDSLACEQSPSAVADYDGDGLMELMLKFDRNAVHSLLQPGKAVTVRVSGSFIDGDSFTSLDSVKVLAVH